MITPMTLHDAMVDLLQENIASKYLLKAVDRDGKESWKNPRVVRSGWIMPTGIDEAGSPEEAFPYIAPRLYKVGNVKGGQETVVTLQVFFGAYDPGVYDEKGRLVDDGSGYRDVWNMIESVRQLLFQIRVIEKRFSIITDYFEAEMVEEQVYPYWEGYCMVKYNVHFPEFIPKFD